MVFVGLLTSSGCRVPESGPGKRHLCGLDGFHFGQHRRVAGVNANFGDWFAGLVVKIVGEVGLAGRVIAPPSAGRDLNRPEAYERTGRDPVRWAGRIDSLPW